MRYCAHCGHIIDEYDLGRKYDNCLICDAILLEDDMTALKYAELSEQEKDGYEQQLLTTIKNSVGFDEGCFQRNCSMDNGQFWKGFRPEKYIQFISDDKEYVEFYTEQRKNNEPFKPFPPIDKEKARQHTHDAVEFTKRIKENNGNKPRCPVCQSTNLSKISTIKKATKVGLFGIFGVGDIGKTWKCNSCGSRF